MTIIPNDSAKIPRTSEAASSGSQSRPLPTPGATTTPSQPENSAHNQLPPVPPRRKHGSVHTAFYPPQASSTARPRVPSPPPYEDDTQQYRAPVALPASPASSMPDLIEASAPPAQTTSQQRSVAPWGNPKSDWNNVAWGENQPSWEITNGDYSGWGKANDAFDASEERWWDRDLMAIGRVKPGPGYLPSAVLGYLHPFIGGMHHIYRVTVTPPDFPPSPEVNHPRSPAPPSSPSIQMTSTSPSTSSALAPHPAPTKEEVLTTIPHPHAIFCRKHGIWLYHQVRTSVHLPPTETYPDSYPFPDQASRKSCTSCVDSEAGAAEEQLYLSSNHVKTHHFHFYQGAIRGSSLSPPFVKPPTLTSARSERRSRKGSSASTTSRPDEPSIVPSEEIWLDLYVCCQCQTHLIVSNESATIPSVIDSKLLRDYIQDRQHNPPPNKTGQEAVMLALETLLRIFENFIFKQNMSAVRVGPSLTTKVGWNDTVQAIFRAVGFEHEVSSGSSPQNSMGLGRVAPPRLSENSPETPIKRARILRAWVELAIVAADYRRRYDLELRGYDSSYRQWVSTELVTEEIIRQVGIQRQMPKTNIKDVDPNLSMDIRWAWSDLGMVWHAHSAELVEYAYRRQTYCNPAETFKYYTALNTIFQWASSVGDSSQEVLGNLIATELSRGRWTAEALREAVNILGLGTLLDDSGAMNVGDDFDAARIKECWLQKLKETNAAFNSQPDLDRDMLNRKKQDLKEAFRIVSEATGRADAVAAYEESVKLFGNGMMDVAAAYSTLEVPADLDEEMVVTIYGMRVDDQPLAEERMRSALMIIAEDRGSERLKNLALTGKDDGPPPPESSRREWPRGLQQLGNTCYLNSLLQYFYTIKELREAITNMDPDNVADVSENDIKQDRVGGRLVSRREVERSKKFVSLLRELFWQLQWSEDAAVKPEVELAKLALVTSKDEEDDIKSEGSDATHASSLQSGSTLVDEPMPFSPGGDSPNADAVEANASVLGKRPGDALERAPTRHAASESDAQPEKDGYVMIEAPKQTTAKSTSGENTAGPVSRDESDVVMHDQQGQDSQVANPPPLPPRKKAEQKTEGTMMFGKQHDVSECMDNCMFQIEAAMKFGLDKTGLKTEDHGSVVKRLFYGKLCQRISSITQPSPNPSGSSVHEKEDLFSQLLVNVADEGFDLYDGLSGRFDDVVDFEDKKARMETSIVDPPPILQIQLQRVQFNRETLEAYKSNAYVKFEESLFIDRFLSNADPVKKERSKEIERELHTCRERLSQLTKGKGGPYDRSLVNTWNMLSQQQVINIEPDFLRDLKLEGQALLDELVDYRAKAASLKSAVENLWKDDRKVEYELCSVFVHRGSSPSFGHYFFYSRDLPDNPDRWLKYNDQDVSSVPKSEVLADTTGSTANPYLLVFARKGANLINTIHRTNYDEFEMDTTDS